MAIVYPDFLAISKLRVPPAEGEFFLLEYLSAKLDSSYEIFFNPFLDGDRPDIIILKELHGAIIIEVKDWIPSLYSVDQNNSWSVYTQNNKLQRIRSPHQQVFRYKNNMFELHLPLLGMKEALNRYFYKVIHPFVYFHESKARDIHSLYAPALDALSGSRSELNDQKKCGQIAYASYDKRYNYLSNKIKQIMRDMAMSFSIDSLDKLIKKINGIEKNILFSEEIYEEFKRRLSPPEWTISQGNSINFDAKQQKYTPSVSGLAKIKGVAGCGKTSILAARAINAYLKHGNVLILNFNITLKQLIRDKISHISHHSQHKINFHEIEITNYHRFFMAQLNNLGKHIDVPDSLDKKELELFFDKEFKDASYFEGEKTVRYGSIFIDEVQDYKKEWITIIREHFLEPDGEMVLFGDPLQNIYQRDEDSLNKPLVRGFGRWEKLTKSYRSPIETRLVTSFKRFQENFLSSRHDELEIFEVMARPTLPGLEILAYIVYDDTETDNISHTIRSYIKKYKIVPNDITIISSKIDILNRINDFFRKYEKTMTTFVTTEEKNECSRNKLHDFEKIERRKKHFFVQNSGLIKISTIHSFKGMESETIFCIFDGNENPEMVYSAITRAKKNLVVFDKKESVYANFFDNEYNTP